MFLSIMYIGRKYFEADIILNILFIKNETISICKNGRVVNFALTEGELRYCHANDFQIRLPDDPAVLSGLDLAKDWSHDLKKAEAER